MFPKLWILMTKWVLHWLLMNFLCKISNIVHDVFAYWYNYSLFIMSPHHLFRNSINMSWNVKCMQQPQFKIKFCKKKNYIFSDSNFISSTRSTDIVSESDSSPFQEHTSIRNRKRRRHFDLDGHSSQVKKRNWNGKGGLMHVFTSKTDGKRRVSSTTYIKSWKMWFRNRVIIFLVINIYITVMSYSLDIKHFTYLYIISYFTH